MRCPRQSVHLSCSKTTSKFWLNRKKRQVNLEWKKYIFNKKASIQFSKNEASIYLSCLKTNVEILVKPEKKQVLLESFLTRRQTFEFSTNFTCEMSPPISLCSKTEMKFWLSFSRHCKIEFSERHQKSEVRFSSYFH